MMQLNPGGLSSTIEFLTAMITPVLLISATGTLVLSTSTRLGRVIDRVRQLEERLSDLIAVENKNAVVLYDEKLRIIFDLLDKVTSRSRLLQRAMVIYYYGLGFFVLTSVSIGAVGILDIYRWLPIAIGLIGILYITYGSFLLMLEAKLATATVNAEMDFTWSLAKQVVPKELLESYPDTGNFGRSIWSVFKEIVTRRRMRKFNNEKRRRLHAENLKTRKEAEN